MTNATAAGQVAGLRPAGPARAATTLLGLAGCLALLVLAEVACSSAQTPLTCTDNADCPKGQICHPDFGWCVAACTPTSCPGNKVCDEDTGACQPDCNTTPCSGGEACEPTTGQCVDDPCGDDPDTCPDGTVCDTGTGDCTVVGCDDDTDCFGGTDYYCRDGTCAEPCTANDCPGGSYCAFATNRQCEVISTLPSCTDDTNCTGATECVDGHCVHECVGDGCGEGMVCDGALGCTYASCSGDADCQDLYAFAEDPLHCDTTSNQCVGSCTSDADCNEGASCNLGTNWCDPTSCSVPAECGSGATCDSGTCVPECGETGCDADEACNPATGACENEPAFVTDANAFAPVTTTANETLALTFSFGAIELQTGSLRIAVSDSAFPGFVAGIGAGSLDVDFGMGSVHICDLMGLDPNSACCDLGEDGYDPGLDPIVQIDSVNLASGIPIQTFLVSVPLGGDRRGDVTTTAAAGDITLTLGQVPFATPGSHAISVQVVSVDPSTGSRGDDLFPEPVRRHAIAGVTSTALPLHQDVWGGTSPSFADPGNWSGGHVPNNDSVARHVAHVLAGPDPTIDTNPTVSGFGLGSGMTLTLQDGRTLTLAPRAQVRVDGTFEVPGATNYAYLVVEGDSTLWGGEGGSFELGTNAIVTGSAASLLTVATVPMRFASGGNFGANALSFDVSSPILVQTGISTIDPRNGSPSSISGPVSVGSGATAVLGDCTGLDLAGSTIDVFGTFRFSACDAQNATILVHDGGGTEFQAGSDITFEQFWVESGATAEFSHTTSLSEGTSAQPFVVADGGVAKVTDGAIFHVGDGLDLQVDGTFEVPGATNYAYLFFEGVSTLSGNGFLDLGTNAIVTGSAASHVTATTVPMRFAGGGNFGANALSFDVSSPILVQTGISTIDPRNGSPSSISGPVSVGSGATAVLGDCTGLDLAGSTIDVFGTFRFSACDAQNATILVHDGGGTEFQAGSDITFEQFWVESGATAEFSHTTSLSEGTSAQPFVVADGGVAKVTDGAIFHVGDGLDLQVDGTFEVPGATNYAYLFFEGVSTLSGNGFLDLGTNAIVTGDPGAMLNVAGVDITGPGSITSLGLQQLAGSDIQASGGPLVLLSLTPSSYAGNLKALDALLHILNSPSLTATSTGGMQASGSGAEIRIENSTLNQALGPGIILANGALFKVRNSTVNNGTIVADPTATVATEGDNTITAAIYANLDIENGSNTILSNQSTGGSIHLNGAGSATGITIPNTEVTFGGGGTLTSTNDGNFMNGSGPGSLAVFDDYQLNLGRLTLGVPTRFNAGAGVLVTDRLTMDAILANHTIMNALTGASLDMNQAVTGSGGWSLTGASLTHGSGITIGTQGAAAFTGTGTHALSGGSFRGSSIVYGLGYTVQATSSLVVDDDLMLQMVNESQWTVNASTVVEMRGGAGVPLSQWDRWGSLEVAGTNLGTDPVNHVGNPAGFANNFQIPHLHIGPGAHVLLRDRFDNGNGGGGSEALYVDELVFDDAAGLLNTNGLPLYFNTLVGSPAQIIDSTWTEPPPGGTDTSFQLYGIAQGGTITITIEGVTIVIVTTAGQTAQQVLQAIADAINAHPVLQALGVTAEVDGHTLVITGGTITSFSIDDPGLSGEAPPIDAAGPMPVLLLAVLLLASGALLMSRRRLGA